MLMNFASFQKKIKKHAGVVVCVVHKAYRHSICRHRIIENQFHVGFFRFLLLCVEICEERKREREREREMIVGIVNELYEGLGPILFYVVLASVLLHVIALVRKSRFFFFRRRASDVAFDQFFF